MILGQHFPIIAIVVGAIIVVILYSKRGSATGV